MMVSGVRFAQAKQSTRTPRYEYTPGFVDQLWTDLTNHYAYSNTPRPPWNVLIRGGKLETAAKPYPAMGRRQLDVIADSLGIESEGKTEHRLRREVFVRLQRVKRPRVRRERILKLNA